MRTPGRTLGLPLAMMALMACGGGGKLGTNAVAMIEVVVDGSNPVNLYDGDPPSLTKTFSQALQDTVIVPVEIFNTGTAPFRVTKINWVDLYLDGDGVQKPPNKYISIDWGGAGDLDFPLDIAVAGSLPFFVVYAPPFDKALDDFNPSVMQIESNAKASDGQTKVPLIEVRFQVPTKRPFPEVSPPNFEFTSPTLQTFTVYNDCDLGTDSFVVKSIGFESATTEFSLTAPQTALPATVDAVACDPDGVGVVNFTVRYAPTDSNDDAAAVLVEIEGLDTPIRVSLEGTQQQGGWEITHNSVLELDFTASDEDDVCESGGPAPCRSFLLRSLGPGVLVVQPTPTVVLDDPPEAEDAPEQYTWNAYTPATKDPESEPCNPTDGSLPATGCTDTLSTSWPRSLKQDAVLRFDVSYTAPLDPAVEPSNGQLILELKLPDKTLEVAALDLFAGEPKSKLVTAPLTGAVVVTASAADMGNSCDDTSPCSKPELCAGGTCGADTGTRHVVVYNEGNGPLTIKSVTVKSAFGVNEHFDLLDPPATPFDIAPNDLVVLEVAWDTTSLIDILEGESETLEIMYVDSYTGADVASVMGLQLLGDDPNVLPLAHIGVSPEPHVVGERIDVHGSESDAGGGGFTKADHSYVWYLVAKPDGSSTRLNENGGVTHGFIPDRPGEYTIELFIVVDDGAGQNLVSEPVQETIVVEAEATQAP